jgi:glutaredoxin
MNTTPSKPVTIYSTATCHFCNLAKEYFKEHDIAYTEYNVGEDRDKLIEMRNLTGQLGVPVIRVNDQVMVGFAPAHFEKLYAAA